MSNFKKIEYETIHRDKVPAALIDLDDFIPSYCMSSYLKDKLLWPHVLPEVLFHSPRPVKRKAEALSKLLDDAKRINNKELEKECKYYLDAIETAMAEIDDEGVFLLYWNEFLVDDINESLQGVFGTYEAMRAYMKKEMESFDELPELFYYSATKHLKTADGNYEESYEYIFVNNEIYYIDGGLNFDLHLSDCDGANLNLPVPFKAGDVIEVNNYPFAPNFRVIITGIGDNEDCCSVWSIFKDYEGMWRSQALKHGVSKIPLFYLNSALFTAELYDGPFEGDETRFPEIVEYIKKNFPDGDMIGCCQVDIANEVLEKVVGDEPRNEF